MKMETKQHIAAATAKSIYEAYPTLWERFGERGFVHTEKDNLHHLDHLETAFSIKDKKIFTDYSSWLETVLTSRNVETALIIDNFERLIDILPLHLEEDERVFMLECLEEAISCLKQT
ncbi:hypothetical protein [Planococcus salinus]|uniref:Uncharacterized protein n=1 Tax=Planococcus salinus TaxID=1848460 RepID=A0A3M8P3W7_9BACL|nr:hypothetical protein [Planococcus salinus]RNF38373.1 hypothetical protein EEX84_14750 [Planococcus salinus]